MACWQGCKPSASAVAGRSSAVQTARVGRVGGTDTAVDGAVLHAATGPRLAQHDGAGATVALAAALFHGGAAQVFAQDFQQGPIRRNRVQADHLAVAYKLQWSVGHVTFSLASAVPEADWDAQCVCNKCMQKLAQL